MKVKMTIEIDNLLPSQATAIEDLMYTWQEMGDAGRTNTTSFFADGDGPFRPEILVNGKEPEAGDGYWEKRWCHHGYEVSPDDFYDPELDVDEDDQEDE